MTAIDPTRVLAMRQQILEQNSALQRAAGMAGGNAAGAAGGAAQPDPVSFGDTFRDALSQVNNLNSRSNALSEAYERGQTTDIAAVMLARQQASIGFEATLQVRNRLLNAYKDIMSMQV